MDFPHDTAQENQDRNSAQIHQKMGKATCVMKSLVKLSQFCYGFKDICKYRKSSVDPCDKMADHWIELQQ